jgi:hypothetical protein
VPDANKAVSSLRGISLFTMPYENFQLALRLLPIILIDVRLVPLALNKKVFHDFVPRLRGNDDIGSGPRPFCGIWLTLNCIAGLYRPIEFEYLGPQMVNPIFSGSLLDVVDV